MGLRLKNKRIKNDRDYLIKWIYLQICVKEKLKILPNYYKIILENKSEENIEELNKIEKNKIDKVLKYKKNIIYKDVNLFFSKMKSYENINLDLLIKYNSIRDEINILNEEKNLLLKSSEHLDKYIKNDEKLYEIKSKYLLNLKNKYTKLLKYKESLKSFIDINENEEEGSQNKKHSNLYYKTSLLLNNLNDYIKYDFQKVGIIKSYKNIPEEEQIVLNLTKLEIISDIFMRKHNMFKINFLDKMNNIKSLLDKNKKLKKNIELIKNNKIKFEKERYKIFKKNSKKTILPTRKMDINNILARNLMMKKMREQKNNKQESIDDYLNDLYEDENN